MGEGGSQPESSPGLYPEVRGGPKGRTGSGWGKDRNLEQGGQATASPRERLPRPPHPHPRTACREQVGPWGGGGEDAEHLMRSLPLRAQGWLWASSDVRRRPPSGLISSGGETRFLGSLSDSVCISWGPGRASVLDQKDQGLGEWEGGSGGHWAENLETPLFSAWWLQGASASPVHEGGHSRWGHTTAPSPTSAPEPLFPSTGPSSAALHLGSPARKMHRCTLRRFLASGEVSFRCWSAPSTRGASPRGQAAGPSGCFALPGWRFPRRWALSIDLSCTTSTPRVQ